MNEKIHVVDHPLVAHKLTILRDKDTSTKDFREIVSEIGMLLTYEATRDLPLTTKEIETPICKMEAPILAGKKFAVVPILRAGLGLVDGVLRMVPSGDVPQRGDHGAGAVFLQNAPGYRRAGRADRGSHAGDRRQRRGGDSDYEGVRL